MNSYWKEVYKAFRRVWGYVITIVGICVSLMFFYVTPSDSIGIRFLIPVAILVFLILAVLTDLSNTLFQERSNILPKIKQAKKPPGIYKSSIALLLLEPSPVFGHETWVSIFFKNEDFEVLAGIGYILVVQENGLIQVLVTRNFHDQGQSWWDQVCGNDQNMLSKLIVKPSIARAISQARGRT